MKRIIITFDTTTDAIMMENFAKENNVSGRLIPIPNEISAGCGLSWDYEKDDYEEIEDILNKAGLNYSKIMAI